MLFLLRKLIKEELKLSSKVSAAKDVGLAVASLKSPDDSYVFIYDPNLVLKLAERSSNTGDSLIVTFKEFSETIGDVLLASVIYGKDIYLDKRAICNNANFVKQSAAIKGLGPAAYDIAMWYSTSKNRQLAPDRGYVSKRATNVWRNYASRDDVKLTDFDNVKKPKTPPPEDDCFVHGEKEIDLSGKMLDEPTGLKQLEANHKKVMKVLKNDFVIFEDDLIRMLSYAADKLFREKF